jgi:serine/threonine protein kinase
MGAVYEAIDERLGITVAVKETVSIDASVRKQFEHEARLLASLQHPALPRVTDHFAEGDGAFLVKQFIAGVDLARIIYQQPVPFQRAQVVAWADQLLDALIYLHSQDRQVIHRDIKPHNLKLTATGQIALLDFGLAKAQTSDASATTSSFFGYTRQYSPLEQIQALSTGPHSDIYALGATLYHLLTGVKPADALMRAAALENGQTDPLKPANLVHPAVGKEIAAILSKAMAQDPEERYRSAAEFREALRRIGRRPPGRQRYMPYPAGSVLFSQVADELEIFKSLPTSDRPDRGPAFVAVMVLIMIMATAGLIYGYSAWRESRATSSGRVTTTHRPTRLLQPAATFGNNTNKFIWKKTADPRRPSMLVEAEAGRNIFERNASSPDLVNPNVARRYTTFENKIEPSPALKAPAIRLPSPEIKESEPKPRLLDSYRPASR